MCEQLHNRIQTEFIEVMEKELRGDTAPPRTQAEANDVVDNSMALVLVPKAKAKKNAIVTNTSSDTVS